MRGWGEVDEERFFLNLKTIVESTPSPTVLQRPTTHLAGRGRAGEGSYPTPAEPSPAARSDGCIDERAVGVDGREVEPRSSVSSQVSYVDTRAHIHTQ